MRAAAAVCPLRRGLNGEDDKDDDAVPCGTRGCSPVRTGVPLLGLIGDEEVVALVLMESIKMDYEQCSEWN